MGKFAYEERTRVVWVPNEDGITDIAAPTTSELTAEGTVYLSPFLKKDGVSTPQNQNNVNSAGIDTSFDSEEVGSWGGSLELQCFRDDNPANDTAWNLFEYRNRGFIVIRRGAVASDAFADGDVVEVYPVTQHQPIPAPSATNEMVTFSAKCAVRSQPELKAIVGGGS